MDLVVFQQRLAQAIRVGNEELMQHVMARSQNAVDRLLQTFEVQPPAGTPEAEIVRGWIDAWRPFVCYQEWAIQKIRYHRTNYTWRHPDAMEQMLALHEEIQRVIRVTTTVTTRFRPETNAIQLMEAAGRAWRPDEWRTAGKEFFDLCVGELKMSKFDVLDSVMYTFVQDLQTSVQPTVTLHNVRITAGTGRIWRIWVSSEPEFSHQRAMLAMIGDLMERDAQLFRHIQRVDAKNIGWTLAHADPAVRAAAVEFVKTGERYAGLTPLVVCRYLLDGNRASESHGLSTDALRVKAGRALANSALGSLNVSAFPPDIATASLADQIAFVTRAAPRETLEAFLERAEQDGLWPAWQFPPPRRRAADEHTL